MSKEIVSDCHGAEVEDNWFHGRKYKTADDIRHICLECGKLCKPVYKEIEADEKTGMPK